MQVKVILKRNVKKEDHDELMPLLLKLRNMALQQPGYISGETLVSREDPDDYLVISTWQSFEDWKRWLESNERQKIQKQVDDILKTPTFYSVYYYGK